MLAKRFFYVCAGLFLFALSYHLGAKSATAQAQGRILPASGSGNVVTSTGDVYQKLFFDDGGSWYYQGRVQTPSPPVFLAQTGSRNGEYFFQVYCENGDIYELSGGISTFVENIFGGSPTTLRSRTWGKVKADYRK